FLITTPGTPVRSVRRRLSESPIPAPRTPKNQWVTAGGGKEGVFVGPEIGYDESKSFRENGAPRKSEGETSARHRPDSPRRRRMVGIQHDVRVGRPGQERR